MNCKGEWSPIGNDNQNDLAPLFDQGATISVGGKVIGCCGSIKKQILDIKQPVYFAELDWNMMLDKMASRKVTFKEITKFPEVRRDLALVIDKSVNYDAIAAIAKKEGKPILKDLILFDVYEGEKLEGKKSYAIGLTFSNDERTLTDSDVDGVMKKLMTRCETELGALIRK